MILEWNSRSLITLLFRRLFSILLIFSIIAAVGIAYILLATPRFEATGSVLVKFGQSAMPDLGGNERNADALQNDRREVVQSNIDILQSDDLLRGVVETLGPDKLYPGITDEVAGKDSPINATIRKFREGDLNVRTSNQSNVIEARLLNNDAQLAADAINLLFKRFIALQAKVYNAPQSNFLDEQIRLSDEQLTRSQSALREFKEQHRISAMQEEMNALLREKSDIATAGVRSIDEARARLAELQEKQSQTLATYRTDSPQARQLRDSIVQAKRALEERQRDLNERGTGQPISTHLTDIDARIAALEAQRNEYDNLVRQVQLDEETNRNYRTKSEEARVKETLNEQNITRIAVVDVADAPVKPARPRKLLTLLATLAAAFLTSLALAILRERFDDSFTAPEQVNALLGLPVIASFPRFRKNVPAAEVETLAHALQAKPQAAVQFISPHADVDTKRILSQAAQTIAQSGKKVLIIDTGDAPQATSQSTLHPLLNIVTAPFDNNGLNPLYTALSPRAKPEDIKPLLAQLRPAHSLILIYSPAILKDASGLSFTRHTDGAVLVLRAEQSRAPVAAEALRLITDNGGQALGAILTRRKFYIPQWLYRWLYR